MMLRKLTRVALHLILVVSMGLAGVVAPLAAAKEVIANMPGAAPMDMPCAEMGAMHQDPTGAPVPKAHCSLAACLGAVACLPAMPRLTAHVPAVGTFDAADVPFVPSGILETPLRPPIANPST